MVCLGCCQKGIDRIPQGIGSCDFRARDFRNRDCGDRWAARGLKGPVAAWVEFRLFGVGRDGTLFDPFGGVQDLQHSLVRFVGDPATRVREDPLRILRFFRFCGHYGLGGLTPDLASILRAAAPGLGVVSEARRAREMALLRATPQATSVLHEMERLGLA